MWLIWENVCLRRERSAKITRALRHSLFSLTFPFFPSKYFTIVTQIDEINPIFSLPSDGVGLKVAENAHLLLSVFSFSVEIGHKIVYDIALVKLSSPVTLSDYVNTICIEPNYTFPAGTTCVTAGWGNTHVGELDYLSLKQSK